MANINNLQLHLDELQGLSEQERKLALEILNQYSQ